MTDRYTKAVLTVIAVCLVYSTAKDMIGSANAQAGATPVNIVAIGGVFPGYSLPVHVQ